VRRILVDVNQLISDITIAIRENKGPWSNEIAIFLSKHHVLRWDFYENHRQGNLCILHLPDHNAIRQSPNISVNMIRETILQQLEKFDKLGLIECEYLDTASSNR